LICSNSNFKSTATILVSYGKIRKFCRGPVHWDGQGAGTGIFWPQETKIKIRIETNQCFFLIKKYKKRFVLVALEGQVGVRGRKNLEYGNKF